MAALLAYLPPFDGLLPKWLFLVLYQHAVTFVGV